MKRSRFSAEQVIAILKQQEIGVPTSDVCREHGISSATFYKWKAKFGGLEVSCPEPRFLLQFEVESVPSKETDYEEIEV